MFDFAIDPTEYPYRADCLYIGEANGQPIGIKTKRHAITIAGSRTGKGVGVINTNLRTWRDNVLVVDPKGEAASVSWEARRDMGQAVHVLDPFERANVPASIRACYNPLDDLDETSLTIAEDIDAISDGMVMRSGDTGAVVWDNGAMQLISGIIAFVVANMKPDQRNLITVRNILIDQRAGGLFETVIDHMSQSHHETLGDLMRSGASRATAKEGTYYVSGAQANTKWLSTKGMKNIMSSSSFSMADLKRKKVSVFVALPFKYLPQQQHGRFLRLMVRCGINAMQEPMPDGSDVGEKCLFILDEFFSLGYIDEVATSIGGMASYGLHLWPFLQDLDQLWKLYGRDGAGTFFGSSDLHQFFGVTDTPTLEYISSKIGVFNVDDMPHEPRLSSTPEIDQAYHQMKAYKKRTEKDHGFRTWVFDYDPAASAGFVTWQGRWSALVRDQQDAHNERLSRFNTEVSRILGKPRLAPDQVAELIRLEEDAPTAAAQIAFVRGGRPMVCQLSRYFEWKEAPTPRLKSEVPTPSELMATMFKGNAHLQTNDLNSHVSHVSRPKKKGISYLIGKGVGKSFRRLANLR